MPSTSPQNNTFHKSSYKKPQSNPSSFKMIKINSKEIKQQKQSQKRNYRHQNGIKKEGWSKKYKIKNRSKNKKD